MNVAVGVTAATIEALPAAAGSTSLFPIHAEMNVGSMSSAFWTCVLPPRMSVVSVFELGLVGAVGSTDAAPGTATLFNSAVELPRSAHVVAVVPVGRVCARKLLYGGGQPGRRSDA